MSATTSDAAKLWLKEEIWHVGRRWDPHNSINAVCRHWVTKDACIAVPDHIGVHFQDENGY